MQVFSSQRQQHQTLHSFHSSTRHSSSEYSMCNLESPKLESCTQHKQILIVWYYLVSLIFYQHSGYLCSSDWTRCTLLALLVTMGCLRSGSFPQSCFLYRTTKTGICIPPFCFLLLSLGTPRRKRHGWRDICSFSEAQLQRHDVINDHPEDENDHDYVVFLSGFHMWCWIKCQSATRT